MTDLNGKVAVITGAGSGIGRALALELARRGARLAVSDIDTVGLEAAARQVRIIGAPVHECRLDVTDRPAVLRYAADVAEHYGVVNVVINNAGIAFTGDIEELSFEQIERVMDVDFWGVVNGTKAFLPYLVASGDGHIVNISSVFGLLSVPGQGAYNAAKFAVRGFTEALRQELLANGHPVRVTCVHPGGVKTAIARNAGSVASRDHDADAAHFDAKLARLSPDAAASAILRAVARNRPRAVIGLDAKLLDLLVRITGPGYQRLVALGARRTSRDTAAEAPAEHAGFSA
jgi:NAD(P)-dependent dehydrogenase (short-subunit alcohol dehydrogenase family)